MRGIARWLIHATVLGSVVGAACASDDVDGARATLAARSVAECGDRAGVDATRAALAVAVANELGGWQPLRQFAVESGAVVLTASADAYCDSNGGCLQTRGFLRFQDESLRDYVDQAIFNPVMYREELKASFGRQRSFEVDVSRNDPSRIPAAHRLSRYGTYYQLGGCGEHYAWRATAPDGSALRNVHAVAGNLVYFGHGSYGNNNPFIDFRVFGNLVLIDPMAADMGVAEELESPPLPPSVPAVAPAIHTPLGRLYDPPGAHVGKPCAADASAPRGELKPLPPSPAFLYCDVD